MLYQYIQYMTLDAPNHNNCPVLPYVIPSLFYLLSYPMSPAAAAITASVFSSSCATTVMNCTM